MTTLELKTWFETHKRELEKQVEAEFEQLSATVYKESIPDFIKKDYERTEM